MLLQIIYNIVFVAIAKVLKKKRLGRRRFCDDKPKLPRIHSQRAE